ncbi:hypothetical protein ACMGD3_07450 [Lysinibacillus sphaericus]|uniref:hypothetical protein n=1 Tax=Lysinibacillus sphaericus TaxID=1421 RepID=UPI003F7A1C8E
MTRYLLLSVTGFCCWALPVQLETVTRNCDQVILPWCILRGQFLLLEWLRWATLLIGIPSSLGLNFLPCEGDVNGAGGAID